MKPHVKVVGFDTGDGGLTSPSGDGQTITFDSTLTGGTLTIDGTDSANAITVNAASGSGAFTVDSGSAAEIDGITIGGAVTTAGTLTLNGDINPTANNFSVEVLDGGTLNVQTSIELASLTIDAGGLAQQTSTDTTFGDEVLTVGSLTIDDPSGSTNGGVLDLGNGDLIVRDTDTSGIYTLLAAGYDGGLWDGAVTSGPNPVAILSSSAANDPLQIESLGFAQIGTDASQGELDLSTFDGQSVYSGDAVVALIYYGDANLDRSVDSTDYGMIGSVAEPYIADGYAGWTNGDFNYGGAVEAVDFDLWGQGASVTPYLYEIGSPAQRTTATITQTLTGGTGTATFANPTSATAITIDSVVYFNPLSNLAATTLYTPSISGTTPTVAAGANVTATVVPGASAVNLSITSTVSSGVYYVYCTLNGTGGTVLIVVTVN